MGIDPASEYPSREYVASIRSMQFGAGEISQAEVTHGFNQTYDLVGIRHRERTPEEAALNSHHVLFPKGRRKDYANELPSVVADLERGREKARGDLTFEKMPDGAFFVHTNGQSCIVVKNGSTYWARVGSSQWRLGADIDETRIGISKLLEKMSRGSAL